MARRETGPPSAFSFLASPEMTGCAAPQDPERRGQVHVDDVVPLLVGHLLDDVVPGVAGVVDDDVQPAVGVHRGRDEAVGEVGGR